MIDIERQLEETLHRALDPIAERPIPPRRGLHSGSAFRTVAGGAGAALTVKLLTAVVAAAAVVTIAGLGATTGSLNPVAWGQQVSATAETCRDNLANSGAHGIGACVSAFASQHGKAVSNAAQHHGSASGNGNGSSNGNGGANGGGNKNSNAGGKGKGKSNNHTPPGKTT